MATKAFTGHLLLRLELLFTATHHHQLTLHRQEQRNEQTAASRSRRKASMTKVAGQVKWFSNRKGYGFVCSSQVPEQDEIFVHHTSIVSPDGMYRTLVAGADVEFDVVPDDGNGKLKAINVTSPGGKAIEPPPPTRPQSRLTVKQRHSTNKSVKKRGEEKRQRGDTSDLPSAVTGIDPPFHDVIKPSIKAKIQSRGLDLNLKSTVDIAVGDARLKLGQGGYAGYVHAEGAIGEGSYDCNDDGFVTLSWKRCLKFIDGRWAPGDPSSLPSSVSLQDESVTLVKADETVDDFWGSDKTDPAESFVEHGFLMRRVVLTRPPRARKPSRDK